MSNIKLIINLLLFIYFFYQYIIDLYCQPKKHNLYNLGLTKITNLFLYFSLMWFIQETLKNYYY